MICMPVHIGIKYDFHAQVSKKTLVYLETGDALLLFPMFW